MKPADAGARESPSGDVARGGAARAASRGTSEQLHLAQLLRRVYAHAIIEFINRLKSHPIP
jgi:hypothetical protein